MPCDYGKYPENWKQEIRPAILKRAHNRCEWCGVLNRAYIRRAVENPAVYLYCRKDGLFIHATNVLWQDLTWQKQIKVVLTVAHLDHDVTNNDPENLAALCQRCHLRYDRFLHKDKEA